MSIAAYQQTIAETEDPRAMEYRVFLKVTLELEKHLGSGSVTEALKTALARNMELWSALRADLMDEDNLLPESLRAGLISLAFSVDRHTPRIIAGKSDVRLLIDINRAIMQGLRGIAHAEPAEAFNGA
ncbi:flagellar biosynthesis regulator FlaF [Arenibaculum pallidiluteum]|uniref:flagellar biosynthesis regulator FlaF n=1 Tax=Arenibaculum pallidiluteum TaxID=2812559 RepID=UPI001A95A2E6|nr:flagellar biosynthesis regulator FlaF [Arenibaculum pallidiluteum]